MLSKLTPNEIESIKSFLCKDAQLDKEEVLTNLRFFEGRVCPHCGSKSHVVRNGHRPSNRMQKILLQRLQKKLCNYYKYFYEHTKKDYCVWDTYINCMLQKKSLWELAKEAGISYATSFYWRHKICDALNLMNELLPH